MGGGYEYARADMAPSRPTLLLCCALCALRNAATARGKLIFEDSFSTYLIYPMND